MDVALGEGILATIAVPAYSGYVKKVKEEVCKVNCLQWGRMYEMYLETENVEHSEVVFEEFLEGYEKSICPEDGVITNVEGKIRYSEHIEDDVGGRFHICN